MKKILSLLIVLIFVISLTSCGNRFDNLLVELENEKIDVIPVSQRGVYDSGVDKYFENYFDIELRGDALRSCMGASYDDQGSLATVRAYEFEYKSDARKFYRCIKKNCKYAKIRENVVVYGDLDFIDDLKF